MMIVHGQTLAEAVHPVRGLLHTSQAIPGNLILGNLGLSASPTPMQGVILTADTRNRMGQ